MNDNTRKIIYIVLVGLPTMLVVWVFGLYIFGCGLSNSCMGIPQPERTSIPTLLAATMPAPKVGAQAVSFAPKCHISALNLIGAWVSGGAKETDPFTFSDAKGTSCTANFKDDVQKLFVTPNLWYDGAPSCTTCHYADVAKATQNMDLSSYAGILAGAHRVNAAPKGDDILGGGNWDKAVLRQMLFAPNGQTQIGRPAMPLGRPATVPAEGPVLSVGLPSGSAAGSAPTPLAGGPTATPGAATETPAATSQATAAAVTGTPAGTSAAPEIARPSNAGGPGDAINLVGDVAAGVNIFNTNCAVCHGASGKGGIANPGSTDGTVPSLNPIDATLIDPDSKTYATNLDLFIQHGSTPEGTSPARTMPNWGDSNVLTQQQIADVIAYLVKLNPASTGATPEPARPSNPGDPGNAVNLYGDVTAGGLVFNTNCAVCHAPAGAGGIANPGSSDGTVPALNPIDPTIANKDMKIFATNIDLFVQHGSTPAGTKPEKVMPSWGDSNLLTQKQIADVIAYIMQVNETANPDNTPLDIARPSNPGGAGEGVTLTGDPKAGELLFTQNCIPCHGAKGVGGIPNPGSLDNTVPPLNPINSTLKNPNKFIFGYNIDLFIEHGSTPEGPSPTLKMPPWGDSGQLAPSQIADIIAYVISLNK